MKLYLTLCTEKPPALVKKLLFKGTEIIFEQKRNFFSRL